MKRQDRGFSLIELMIVIAIIAILAAIALPLLRAQQARAAEHACLAEMKIYAGFVLAAISNETTLPLPSTRACATTDVATAASVFITGTPRSPGTHATTCDMGSSRCTIVP